MISKLITWGDDARARHRSACAARSPNTRCAASARRFRSSSGSSRTRTSRRRGSTPASSIASSATGRCGRSSRRTKISRPIAAAVHLFTKPVGQRRGRRRGREPLARRRPRGSAAMIFEVAIGERVRTVERGRARAACCTSISTAARTSWMRGASATSVVSLLVQLGDASAAVAIDRCGRVATSADRRGDFDVHLDGRTIAVQIRPAGAFGRQNKAGAAPRRPGRSASSRRCRARSCACWSKPGDEVKAAAGPGRRRSDEDGKRTARRSRRPGRATSRVAEGQSVDAGAVLLVVE